MRRVLVVVAALFVLSSPAFAHVAVSPADGTVGAVGEFTFTLEDEKADANTALVEIYLPDDVASDIVSPTSSGGWTFETTREPRTVRFTHPAPAPSGDAAFLLRIDPLPSAERLIFKVVQTYDNGDVDRWIDFQSGSAKPPHPAPVVKVTGATPTTNEVVATSPPTTRSVPDDDDNGEGGSAAPFVVLGAVFIAAFGAGVAIAVRRRGAT
ncbi:MAG TPA: DUF1775 domain-containing protein [Acidimicrobiales bacterium]|nr:DUF1775 domain-containing protein [Acidimicrobiales bacterium]